ncbi:hypothetical protein CCR75_001582 [Bremia lactucae]|uniref:tRNA-intron lyase n=1 Tax=Bremia lactucae TaxID=4779 RepID=A0A976ICP2_BRELC|nr:hypothetical protein CCR75_001582 [Bremia lactucae]
MTDCAVAILVASPLDFEATYALVHDAQHIDFLQQVCRIHGSLEENLTRRPPRLRLALEEVVVGVQKGFLRLESALKNNDRDDHSKSINSIVERAIRTLVGADTDCRDFDDDFKWKLSLQRRERLQIFHDLWNKGYIVTFGSKFGADFLIYKDSPKHAHAVALIVVKGFEEEFARVDIVSFCRIAKMVKKQLVFASVRTLKERECESERADEKTDSLLDVTSSDVVYVSLTHALLVSRQDESGDTM